MVARNPRLMVVLEPPLYQWIKQTARKQGLSLSLLIRDLIKDAYSDEEDRFWSQEGEKRLASFSRKSAVSHAELKKRFGIKG